MVLTEADQAEVVRAAEKIVPGRSCGSCTLCCKVMAIAALAKPPGRWCPSCKAGRGCAIYESRPFSCRVFYCEWIIAKGLGPEWKPDHAKFVLFKTEGGRRLTAHVDPGNPQAWRRSPYYENIKQWAKEAAQKAPDMHLVDIMIGERSIAVLPDRDVDLGVVGADEMITLERRVTPQGPVIDVRKVKRAEVAVV
jgi:hypothetical protein